MSTHENKDEEKQKKPDRPESTGRRDALKTLATVPVLGAMAYGVIKKNKKEHSARVVSELFQFPEKPASAPVSTDKIIRIGIIGGGIRGFDLLHAMGFTTPENIENMKKEARENTKDTRYKDFIEQEDIGVKITAVCDIFDAYAERAILAGSNMYREGKNGKLGERPKRYLNYKELLAAPEVDAVIIATPDHWHGTMAIDAIKAGKHIYLEKPMTWTVPETYALRDAVRNSNIVFQLGHQNRQNDVNKRGKEIVEKGLLGPITMIETSTNRNDPNGA